MKRIVVRELLILVIALAGVMILAAPSSAAAPAQVCARVNGTGTFAPGLLTAPKNSTLKAKANETGCSAVATTGGSGVLTATIKVVKGSCVTLAKGNQKMSATGATAWQNGKTSKYSFTFVTGSGGNVSVASISGRVTSGLFAGHKLSGALRFATVGSPNCKSKPLKSITLMNTKSFVIT